MGDVMRFTFPEPVDLGAVEHDMTLSLLVAEFIHGKPRVRLEAGYDVAPCENSLKLLVSGPAGETAVQVFAGFCSIGFGEDGYLVERRGSGEAATSVQGASR